MESDDQGYEEVRSFPEAKKKSKSEGSHRRKEAKGQQMARAGEIGSQLICPCPGPEKKWHDMIIARRSETGDARPDEETRNGLISREILLAGCHMAHSVDTIDTSNWV